MFNWFSKKYSVDEYDVPKTYTEGFLELKRSIEKEAVWYTELSSYKAYCGHIYYTINVRDTKRNVEYALLSSSYDNKTTYEVICVTFPHVHFTKEEQNILGNTLFDLYEYQKQKRKEEELNKFRNQVQKETNAFLNLYREV